jgi:hypothetical protein
LICQAHKIIRSARTISIEMNTCDELNTDVTNQTQYPLSNACGQYGSSYQGMLQQYFDRVSLLLL